METGLANKTVVVTGASGGIGGAVAEAFWGEGANVVWHGNSGVERARQRAGARERTMVVGADLRDEGEVATMFDQVESTFGPAEVLVANAGVWPVADECVWEISLDRWRKTLDSNLTSTFLTVREFLRRCQSAKIVDPSIVMIGSTAGDVGEAGHADYAAAKSGLMGGLLNSLKNEIPRIAARGRVNCISPGWTLTPMAEKFAANEPGMIRALQTIPLKKFAGPGDIAALAVFLSSSRLAGHITGECIFVSGGMEGRVLNDPSSIDLSQAIPESDT